MQAVRDGATRYTAVTGEAALRKAICDDLERRKGVKYAPEEIIVGNGAKQEVYQAVLALCRYFFVMSCTWICLRTIWEYGVWVSSACAFAIHNNNKQAFYPQT